MLKASLLTKKMAVKKTTDNALEWFPELEKLFENFNVKHIKLSLEDTDDFYMIFKDE